MTEEEIKAMEEALAAAQGEVERQLATIRARDERIGELEAAAGNLEKEMDAAQAQLGEAVAKYRSLVLSAAPEVPEELVKGETVTEVDASLKEAQGLVDRVKQQFEARVAAESIPAGAPPRTLPDLSTLSPREKIAYALTRQGQ